MHRLQVQIPAPAGDIVGVTDAVSEPRATLTDFTHFRHIRVLLVIDSYELSTAGSRLPVGQVFNLRADFQSAPSRAIGARPRHGRGRGLQTHAQDTILPHGTR